MTWVVHTGDNLDALRQMPDCSVDAVVTDPPYGLGTPPDAMTMLRAWLDNGAMPIKGRGFMGKEWDAFVPQPATWREVYRVLKPGGHLLAFAGARTQDLMALSLRIAGFEIRDMLGWLYGSGFPKSLDVSKAIDKGDGYWRGRAGKAVSDNNAMSSGNYTRTPKGDPITAAAAAWSGWGTALKPAIEPITLARKPLDGTVAANVLKWGAGGLNVDGCRVDGEDVPEGRTRHGGGIAGNASSYELPNHKAPMPAGRWPANLLHDGSDEVAAVFPDDASRFFYSAKTAAWEREIGLQDAQKRTAAELVDRDADSAGMANPAAVAGRTSAGRANTHPTVKGVDVMRWLVRLVTPLGGTVLDPYTGSGTTGMACILEGFAFIGCELSAEYADIARARIAATEARQGVKVTDGKLTADDTPVAQMRLL